MELHYAPPAKSSRTVGYIIAAGLCTTAATLFAVFVLHGAANENIMGWHIAYIIPVGATVVGLAASAGYGIASWVTGLKIRKKLLRTIVRLQVVAYFGAQFATFASLPQRYYRAAPYRPTFVRYSHETPAQLTFTRYFYLNATQLAWRNHDGDVRNQLLIWAGFIVIGVEILGFALAGLVVPGLLRFKPCCGLCQMYLKTRKLGTVPASIAARKVAKNDAAASEAYRIEQEQALAAGKARVDYFMQVAAAGDAAALRENLDTLRTASRAAEKLPARIRVSLACCPSCRNGNLRTRLFTGHGERLRSHQLQKLDVSREFVQQLTDPQPPVPLPDAVPPRVAA